MGRDRVRVVGIARDIADGAPATWRLTSSGQDKLHHDAGSLVVEAPERDVRVEVRAIEVLGEPEVQTGGWRDLVARAAPRFAEGDTLPFTEARLAVTRVNAGDRVAVWGEVIGRDRAGKPDHVLAIRIARGSDAEARIARHEPIPDRIPASRPSAARWLPALVGLAGAIAWIALADGPWQGVAGPALALVAAAIVMRPSFPGFDLRAGHRDTDEGGGDAIQVLGVIVALATAPLALLLVRWAADIAGGVLVVVGLATWLACRRILRDARELMTAGPLRGNGAASLRGRVRVDHPVKLGAHLAAFGVDADVEIRESMHVNSDNWDYKFKERGKLVAAPAFTLVTDGGEVEVSPRELVWATACRETSNQKTGSNTKTYHVREWVPVDAEVAVTGWVEGTPPKLRSRGTRPAVLFASPAGGDPLEVPRGIVRYWRMVGPGLVVVALALAAIEITRLR